MNKIKYLLTCKGLRDVKDEEICFHKRLETIKGESLTIQGQAISGNEILKRFLNGETVMGAKQAYYASPENFDINPVESREFTDLSDAYEQLQNINESFQSKKVKEKVKEVVNTKVKDVVDTSNVSKDVIQNE